MLRCDEILMENLGDIEYIFGKFSEKFVENLGKLS